VPKVEGSNLGSFYDTFGEYHHCSSTIRIVCGKQLGLPLIIGQIIKEYIGIISGVRAAACEAAGWD
jgi:hypothetical protein